MAETIENEMMEEGFEEDTTKDLYLTFVCDNEDYAIDVANIKEIIPVCPITFVPQTEEYVKGIINLRGDIVPVICVRSRFFKPAVPHDEATCIIVIEYEEFVLGLIVDRVKGVATIPESMITPPPNAKLSYSNQFVRSIGKVDGEINLLLDLDKLIF